MLPDDAIKCPHTGFAESCRSIVARCNCPKFVKISGVNPNDGQPIDKFGCIDSFLHMLLIENSQQQRQTGAAVESFRNEMVKANAEGASVVRSVLAVAAAPNRQLLG